MSKDILTGTRPDLPPTLTSYDFLKTTALILMVIDHVGYFFFPDDMWWRAIGRLSAPIWLFLVGYARSRDLGPRLWVGAGLLLASSYVFGMAMFPITILVTILLCRLALDPLMDFLRRQPQALYPVMAVIFVCGFPTFPFFEYGAMAMLPVIAGYIVRNRAALGYSQNQVLQCAGIVALLYAFVQAFVFFIFPPPLRAVVMVGTLMLMLFLTGFQLYEYPKLTKALGPLAALLRFCGRRTLEIYVAHLVLFKALAWHWQTQDLQLFNFHMF